MRKRESMGKKSPANQVRCKVHSSYLSNISLFKLGLRSTRHSTSSLLSNSRNCFSRCPFTL